MAAPTKNQKIEALAKLVQKRSRGAGLATPPQRSVLETLMYAALLENTTYDKADLAYAILDNYYIDWNEIRVCSVRELADTLTDLPRPEAAAERVRKALQGVFEKTYTFDLEDLRKKGKALAEHIKFLDAIPAGTPFMIQYVAQVALDGHVIPLDEASLRVMRRLGLSQVSSDGTQEICTGLDRVILKKSSLTFAMQLHHFAASYYDVPDSPELLSLLSAIDRDAVDRSWTCPIVTTPPAKPATASTPEPVCDVCGGGGTGGAVEAKTKTPAEKPNVPKAPAKETPVKGTSVKEITKETPVAKPAKPAPKQKLPAKPMKKPAKKSIPVKPTASKGPTKPIESVKPTVKKTSPKKAKVLPSKKAKVASSKKVLPKKSTKPLPAKKKIPAKVKVKGVVKKSPAKPVKKSNSPSKALRKKKPK